MAVVAIGAHGVGPDSHRARIHHEQRVSGLRVLPEMVAPMRNRTLPQIPAVPSQQPRHHSPEPGSGNRWLVLIAMTGALSMVMLDQTVVSVALPR